MTLSSMQRAGCTTYDEIYGTQVAINVYEPKVRGQNDLSASWALMVNGPTGNYEGIGAGSIVSYTKLAVIIP